MFIVHRLHHVILKFGLVFLGTSKTERENFVCETPPPPLTPHPPVTVGCPFFRMPSVTLL